MPSRPRKVGPRATPMKHCQVTACMMVNPTGVRYCYACGAEFYRKGVPPLAESIRILMRAASNDVRGAGCGIRSTTDTWRSQVSAAWAVCFRKVNGWQPSSSDYYNAGMSLPPEL